MSNENNVIHDSAVLDGRIAGGLLLATALLSTLMMAHHPSLGARDAQEAVREIVAESSVNQWVHGTLIAALGALLTGYLEVSRRVGLHQLSVRAAAMFYGAGVASMVGAALISGFLIPGLVTRRAGTSDSDRLLELVAFAGAGNQVLAIFGVIAMSLGIGLWSVALLRRRSLAVGSIGLIASLVPIVSLASGVVRLNVGGMLAILVCWNVWHAVLGVKLLRNKL